MTKLEDQLSKFDDLNQIASMLKLKKALAAEHGDNAVKNARLKFEDALLPQLEKAEGDTGKSLTESELRKKIWEIDLKPHLLPANNANHYVLELLSTIETESEAQPANSWAKKIKEHENIADASPDLTARLKNEITQHIEAELQALYQKETRHGIIPRAIPFPDWKEDLTKNKKANVQVIGTWKAICTTAPEKDAQELNQILLQKNTPWESIPGGSQVKELVQKWTKEHPKPTLGTQIFESKANATPNLEATKIYHQTFTLDTKVLRFADRDIIKLKIGEEEQGFYRSSGRNSGMAGNWFPFDGIKPRDGQLWFDKTTYVENHRAEEDPLHRYGTDQLKAIGERLEQLAIPKGQEATVTEINNHISNNPEHPSQKNNRDWDAITEWQEIAQNKSQENAGPICRTDRALDCKGLAIIIDTSESQPQAFCRDKTGNWWPIDGLGVRPDSSPMPSTENYYGPKIPKNLQGYGTEEIKSQAERLNAIPPKPGPATSSFAVNNTIAGKDPNHTALGLNLQIQDFQRDKENKSGVRPYQPGDISQVVSLPENTRGRDFIIGDLRGHFDTLVSTLKEVKFHPLKDRLLCTGDLCDQGPKGQQCLALLQEPWFYSTKGNHDHAVEMVLQAYFNPTDKNSTTKGAQATLEETIPDWLCQAMESSKTEELRKTLEQIQKMPIILAVGEGPKRFHVVHGSLSPKATTAPRILTDKEIDALAENRITLTNPENLINDTRISKIDRSDTITRKNPGALETSPTYCGHTPTEKPKTGLHICLDTGAGHQMPGAGLSITEHESGLTKKTMTIPDNNPNIAFFLAVIEPKKEQIEIAPTSSVYKKPDPMNPLPVAGPTTGKKPKNQPEMNPFSLLF